MARYRFVINREKLHTRCEICHQSDRFNPHTGVCARCQHLPTEQIEAALPTQLTIIKASIPASLLALLIAVICFSASVASLHVVLVPSQKDLSWYDLRMLYLVSVFNFLFSLVLKRWCTDANNSRLDFIVVVVGRFCSGLGILSSIVVFGKRLLEM